MKPRVYFGDCLTLLDRLPEHSFDLVLTDPPYNTSGIDMKWENKLDGGNWYKINENWDTYSFESYLDFTREWIRKVNPLLKTTGTIMVCCSQHNISEVMIALKELKYKCLNIITWRKMNPMPNLTRRVFTHSTEFIVWFAKGSHYTFHYEAMKKYNNGKQLRDVWEFPVCQGKERIRRSDNRAAHPTQKPLALFHRLIEASTNPGDQVFDPFLGSGTTAEACIRLGRLCTGIEKEEAYYQIALDRIDKVLNDTREFRSGL
ncbi:DNA-methyltransferase [Effusibacillus consociatus]|uniref:Methyltransferase n=1 Tax=Effusibacillus consociatus TaxID=1117041 RepID=A0ABV9QC20_9BACL